jgi:F-type H+-transporting ATPase subunit b
MLEINLTLPLMMAMFLLFAVGMNVVFFAPVTRALEARKAHIEQQHQASLEASEAAIALQADYEARLKGAQLQAQEAIQTALKAADDKRQALLAEAQAQLGAELQNARKAIRAEKERALASLHSEVDSFSDMIQRKALTQAQASSPHGAVSASQGGV